MLVKSQILLLASIYLLIFLSLGVTRLWNRLGKGVKESYSRMLCQFLEPQDSLPSLVFPEVEYSFHRRILIGLLNDLTVMLQGVEGRILLLIFHDNGLYRHILRECRYKSDYRKTRAMSVFQDIPIPGRVMDELKRFLDSDNSELRMMTLLVWLNQESGRMMERLARYPHRLSERECANIYALAQRRNVPMRQMDALLNSPNSSVSRFGRRLLRINDTEQ